MDKNLKQDIFQWDVANWSRAVRNWSESIEGSEKSHCLAFGEREGGISLWLTLNGHDVICTDYNEFNEIPLALHVKHNVQDKIVYKSEDITNPTFEDNSFDMVVFKSVVGSLGNKEDQVKAFKEIYRILKPGGKLLFAENLSATKLHKYARKKFTNWGERWYYPSITEIKEYVSDFKSFTFETTGVTATFGRSEKQRAVLNKIDIPIAACTPKSWHYILSGIAIK